MALKSSETLVLTSPPIFSPAHCLTRPSFLLIFIVADYSFYEVVSSVAVGIARCLADLRGRFVEGGFLAVLMVECQCRGRCRHGERSTSHLVWAIIQKAVEWWLVDSWDRDHTGEVTEATVLGRRVLIRNRQIPTNIGKCERVI